MVMHLVRLHNYAVPIPTLDANGTCVRRLLAAACAQEKEMKFPVEAAHTLRGELKVKLN